MINFSSVPRRYSLRALLAFIALAFIPVASFADTFTVDGITYCKDIGTDLVLSKSDGSSYSGDIVIPDIVDYNGISYTVVAIAENAFKSCRDLTSVKIGANVTTIGEGAFMGCTAMKELFVPVTVEEIGVNAFAGSGLNRLTLENSEAPLRIDRSAFDGCALTYLYVGRRDVWRPIVKPEYLGYVEIGPAEIELPSECFKGCSFLWEVKHSGSLKYIGSSAFEGCISLYDFDVPSGVDIIMSNTFKDCTLMESMTLPESVTVIGKGAFSGCTSLRSIHMSSETDEIRDRAFEGCNFLREVTIPPDVMIIGSGAFAGCTGLETLRLEDGRRYRLLLTDDAEDGSTEASFKGCAVENLFVGRRVNSWKALCNSPSLKNVEFTDFITEIGPYAFQSCTGLTEIGLPPTVTTISEYAFRGCSGLRSLNLPDSLAVIGRNAFEGCTGLRRLVLPNGPIRLNESSFRDCTGLQEIILFDKTDYLFFSTFEGCTGLKKVLFPHRFPETLSLTGTEATERILATSGDQVYENGIVYTDGRSQIQYASYNLEGTFDIPESVTTIGNGAFASCPFLTLINLHDGVTALGDNSFARCTALSSFELPDGVASIGEKAFEGSSNIADIICRATEAPEMKQSSFAGLYDTAVLNAPVDAVDNYLSNYYWYLFKNMRAGDVEYGTTDDGTFTYRYNPSTLEAYVTGTTRPLSSASIPSSVSVTTPEMSELYNVTRIAPRAFSGMALGSVTFPETLKEIHQGAFLGCSGLTTLNFPAGLTIIGEEAFRDCSGLRSAVLGDNLTVLGNAAFRGCRALETVGNIKVPVIGDYCFYLCEKLKVPEIECTRIGDAAFSTCPSLGEIKLTAEIIGSLAFHDPSTLDQHELTIYGEKKGDTPLFRVIENSAFENVGIRNFNFTDTEIIGDLAFNRTFIKVASLPVATTIGERAFSNSWLETIIMPGVTSIGKRAFEGTSLKYATIPAAVKNIYAGTFDCPLTSLTFIDASNPINIEEGSFRNTIKNIYLGRNYEGDFSFAGSWVNKLTVGNLVTELPESAFKECSWLTDLTFGTGLETIPAYAFRGCSALKEIVIPSNVTAIGDAAFNRCYDVTGIYLGAGIASIGEEAFGGCQNATLVAVAATTAPKAAGNTFNNYSANLYVPYWSMNEYYSDFLCWYQFEPEALVEARSLETYNEVNYPDPKPNSQYQLSATVFPADATLPYVFWRSTNPAYATVTNDGLVTIRNHGSDAYTDTGLRGEIIAETMYADGPTIVFNFAEGMTVINRADIDAADSPADNNIYNLQGITVRANASEADLRGLTRGIYIFRGKKVRVN